MKKFYDLSARLNCPTAQTGQRHSFSHATKSGFFEMRQ